MNIREQAKAVGGDELVAHIDAGKVIERDLCKKLSALVTETLEGKKAGMEEQIALTALCEAFSAIYAHCVAVTTLKAFNNQRPEGIITAIRSTTHNINQAFDLLDAQDGDVLAKIIKAAAKGSK